MRILLINHLENARESMRSNKVRTRLTILGITLGIMCITAIMALSSGVVQLIQSQIDQLGGNILVVRPENPQKSDAVEGIISGNNSYSVSSLTENDINKIKENKNIKEVAPIMSVSGSIKSATQEAKNSVIISTTPNLEKISQLKIRDGQFIDSVTNDETAVIGQQLSVDLFGTESSIGQTFKIRGQTYTVIGILKTVNNSISYNNFDINRSAIINFSAGKKFNQGIAQIRQINVQMKDGADPDIVKKEVEKSLMKTHGGEEDFSVLSGKEISTPTSSLFTAVRNSTIIVAIVSLIIGGIGVMNIMLVSVAERTREIGIRKSVGASNGHILMQFMIESVAMSFFGGLNGFVLGYAVAFMSGIFLPFSPGFSWWIPAVAFGLSVLVGTIFGMYPAIRAAAKNPIEALRQYQ